MYQTAYVREIRRIKVDIGIPNHFYCMCIVHQQRYAVQSTIKVIYCITLSTVIAFKIYTYFPTGMFRLLFTKPLSFKSCRKEVEMLLHSFFQQFDLNSYWPIPFAQCVEIFSEGIFPILLLLQFHEIFITNSYCNGIS